MIVCDERESRSEIPALLQSLGIEIEIKTLEDGDYILPNNVIVSRKTISDFFGSRNSGHLNDEIYRLLSKYPDSIIFMILEKNTFNTRDEIVIANQAYRSLQFVIPVVKTKDKRETAETLVYYHKKALNNDLKYFKRRITLLDNTNDIIRLYLAFPGISYKIAEMIYKEYPVPIDFFNAVLNTYKYNETWKTKKLWKENRWDKNIKFIGEKRNENIGNLLKGLINN